MKNRVPRGSGWAGARARRLGCTARGTGRARRAPAAPARSPSQLRLHRSASIRKPADGVRDVVTRVAQPQMETHPCAHPLVHYRARPAGDARPRRLFRQRLRSAAALATAAPSVAAPSEARPNPTGESIGGRRRRLDRPRRHSPRQEVTSSSTVTRAGRRGYTLHTRGRAGTPTCYDDCAAMSSGAPEGTAGCRHRIRRLAPDIHPFGPTAPSSSSTATGPCTTSPVSKAAGPSSD